MTPEMPNLNEIVLQLCRERLSTESGTFAINSSKSREPAIMKSNVGGNRQLSVIFGIARGYRSFSEIPPGLVDSPMAHSALATRSLGGRHIGYWRDLLNCFWVFFPVWRLWLTMGRKFGNLTRGKNIVTYSLSPFEQRAFAGITKSIANMARRVRTQLPYQLPAFISGILLYTWAMEDFHKRNRKNPKDFENDEWTFQHIAMWIFLLLQNINFIHDVTSLNCVIMKMLVSCSLTLLKFEKYSWLGELMHLDFCN